MTLNELDIEMQKAFDNALERNEGDLGGVFEAVAQVMINGVLEEGEVLDDLLAFAGSGVSLLTAPEDSDDSEDEPSIN